MKQCYGITTYLGYKEARTLEAEGHVKICDGQIEKKIIEDTSYNIREHYSPRKFTRVAWVQNYNKNGGAEISNFNLVKAGSKLGFDIIGCYLNSETISYNLMENADILIVNNLHCAERGKFIEWLFKFGKPFIKYDHDYFEDDIRLFQKSIYNFFISPAHMEHYIKLCGEEIRSKSICLPLAFDVDRWTTEGEHKKNTVLIPTWRKCRINGQEFINKNKQFQYTVIDDLLPVGNGNVYRIDAIDYEKMQTIYPKYEYILHTTDNKWSGERVIFEATMSGCKVITNENSGHTSWPFNWRNADELKPILTSSLYEFWKRVDNCVNKLNIQTSTGQKTINIVTRCMNRKNVLMQTVPTWLKYNNIKKVIIVDWGMKEPLDDLLIDDRLEIAQVPNKETFEQSEAWNVGIRRCTSDYIFMVDCDVLFNSESYTLNKLLSRLTNGEYSENDYIVCGVTPSHLTGTSIFLKKQIEAVNGFCEKFPTRGYEEIDLRNRINNNGGKRCPDLFPGMIEHIDHSDKSRFENMKEKINILEADKINQDFVKNRDVKNQKHEKLLCSVLTKMGKQEGVLI